MKEWRELNTRWYQFGTFVPLYRSHGQFPYREVFHIAPEKHPAYQSIIKYNKLRYRLMPYIYSLAGQVYFDDYTIMRALVMDFPNDPEVTGISDQYMFGSSLMISPVYKYKAREREVYFPSGQGWFDLESGSYTMGGIRESVPAPYEQIPIHVKAGSIIPVGPDIQYVGEKPDAPLTLYVYGEADGEFTLYEDEGLNYNYEKGAFSKISFHYDHKALSLEIGEREGSYEGMPTERIFNVVLVDREHPRPLESSARNTQEVIYTGTKISMGQ